MTPPDRELESVLDLARRIVEGGSFATRTQEIRLAEALLEAHELAERRAFNLAQFEGHVTELRAKLAEAEKKIDHADAMTNRQEERAMKAEAQLAEAEKALAWIALYEPYLAPNPFEAVRNFARRHTTEEMLDTWRGKTDGALAKLGETDAVQP